ncbi:MAG: potassium/proton antiporter [Muribaculaceae bacterium]|nr:potassium/proton antiporter [Muribaculaceae bacterium]
MGYITSDNVILVGSILLMCGVMFGKISYRLGLPLLLVFLLVGMGFGVDGLGLQFHDMHTAQFIGMIALSIILFSGGLDTKLKSIRPVAVPGMMLATIGVLLTSLFTGLFVWWVSSMAWSEIQFALLPSILLAATMSSTDSASVFGILGSQKVGLKQNLKPMLELESGSNDPMAYMLTIILIEAINLGTGISAGSILGKLALQFFIGGAVGLGIGKSLPWLIKRYRRSNGGAGEDESQASAMLSILTLGGAFLTFGVANVLGGNGYLAVYLCGIMVGNSGAPLLRSISRFMSGMSWLGQIVVFLMLGLLVNPHEMVDVAGVAILISLFMMFVGRPLSVLLCLLPFRRFTMKSKIFVSWVGLRGAVPIIFATYPVIAEIEGASQIFNIVFFVTLISLLLQGTTVLKSAKMLDLIQQPDEDESDFGVELSETLPTKLKAIRVEQAMLLQGNTLRHMNMPKGTLVMMIKRGNDYIVPNGNIELKENDALLIIEEADKP